MMSSNPAKVLAGLFGLILTAGTAYSQEAKDWPRADLIRAARDIMQTSRYCSLITIDRAGQVHARAMDPFPPDENMVVWFGTNQRSRKVLEIRRQARVTLYYFDRDAQAYVTIHGRARLVNDPAQKAKLWKDEWKAFYPDRNKDYILIAVEPDRLELVSVKRGIVGDSRTWTPPSVTFPRTRNLR
jgi:general stress protein 26